MENTQKHWTANSPHAGNNHRPSHKVWTDEVDQPIGSGPCDGYEAGRLLTLYGDEAVEAICERVAQEGGR